jgi:hypothetical protein
MEAAVGERSAYLFLFLCLGMVRTLKWVRRHFLIERFGYVEAKLNKRKLKSILLPVLAVSLAFVLSAAIFRPVQPDRWILAGIGLIFGVFEALVGQLPRFVLGSVLSAAAGIFLASSGVPVLTGLAAFFGFQGLMALIPGGVVFLLFLREPAETGE